MNKRDKIRALILQCLIKQANEFVKGKWIQLYVTQHKDNPYAIISRVAIREYIAELRATGLPIVASAKGYKYSTRIKEVKDYCKSRKAELEKEMDIICSMEKNIPHYCRVYEWKVK